jgi:hypothetical protein
MKRISLQVRDTKVSGYFSHHETDIYNALVDDSSPTRDSLEAFYVSNRDSNATADQINTLLRRLPSEFGNLYRDTIRLRQSEVFHENLRVDFYELDLIDFLLNIKKNRVLRLVGSVGVGKTTFLNYIFQCIRSETKSLLHLLPININFTRYPQRDLNKTDLAEMIWQSMALSLEREVKEAHSERKITLDQLLSSVLQHGVAAARAGTLYSMMRFIRETFQATETIEPVFIFDNLDHLDGESVEQLSHFSRALFIETRCCIILAMRPPAFATHLEIDAHKGAFYSFRIVLRPPDLRSVFSRRLKRIVKKEALPFEVEGTQITLRVDDVESAVRNITDNLLDAPNQRLLLEGVSNRNIRKAGRAFATFLRWPGLRPDLLVAKAPREARRELPGGFYEHLLRGVMLGSAPYFCDEEDDRALITNVYQFICSGFAVDYLIQYHILSLVDWAMKLVPVEALLDWMMALGYQRQHVGSCIEHLLRRNLIYSPETELYFYKVKSLSPSASGTFYLTELVANDQYLFEAIPDVLLRHDHIVANDRHQYVGRIHSILELIERVEAIEKHQLSLALKTNYAPKILGALDRSGLLQRRLLIATDKLINAGFRSDRDSVREGAQAAELQIKSVKLRTEMAERKLMEYLIGENLRPREPNEQSEVFRAKWADNYAIEMRAPAQLSPATPNVIKIECHVSNEEDANSLFGRIEDVAGNFDEMAELRRKDGTEVFAGQFVVPWREKVSPLPPSMRLSLFADARPIFRKILEAQSS